MYIPKDVLQEGRKCFSDVDGGTTSHRFSVRLLCLAWTFSLAASEVTWILGAGGASCDETCRARGGCNEEEWPKTENEFLGWQNLIFGDFGRL